ncbi:hypothetical protein D3C71_1962250 [compost metagenome]
MLAHFGTQVHYIAVERNMDVFLSHAWHFGLHGVAAFGFLHVNLDLTGCGQVVAVQRTHVKARCNVLKEVIKQTAACHKRVHGICS